MTRFDPLAGMAAVSAQQGGTLVNAAGLPDVGAIRSQLIEARSAWLVTLLWAVALLVLLSQAAGWRRVRAAVERS